MHLAESILKILRRHWARAFRTAPLDIANNIFKGKSNVAPTSVQQEIAEGLEKEEKKAQRTTGLKSTTTVVRYNSSTITS